MTCTPKGCRCSAGEGQIRVIPGKTTINGSCERAIVEETISRRFNEVRFCYAKALPSKSNLTGEVAASLTIDSTGTVSEVNLGRSTVNNQTLEQCLLSRIRHWTFPKLKVGGACSVNYTFIFKAAGSEE